MEPVLDLLAQSGGRAVKQLWGIFFAKGHANADAGNVGLLPGPGSHGGMAHAHWVFDERFHAAETLRKGKEIQVLDTSTGS